MKQDAEALKKKETDVHQRELVLEQKESILKQRSDAFEKQL